MRSTESWRWPGKLRTTLRSESQAGLGKAQDPGAGLRTNGQALLHGLGIPPHSCKTQGDVRIDLWQCFDSQISAAQWEREKLHRKCSSIKTEPR